MYNRIAYIDWLRSIACFAVVVLHVSGGQEWFSAKEVSFEWTIFNLYDSLVRWCVPIFIMISGALFLNPEKEIGIHKLYVHKHFVFLHLLCFGLLCMHHIILLVQRIPTG